MYENPGMLSMTGAGVVIGGTAFGAMPMVAVAAGAIVGGLLLLRAAAKRRSSDFPKPGKP